MLIYLCKQGSSKKPNYVQISVESYSHLTGLEDQVKTYEEKVQKLEDEMQEMNEKLSAANSEIETKEGMVKQHAKVAEEAVSGIMLNDFIPPQIACFDQLIFLGINFGI